MSAPARRRVVYFGTPEVAVAPLRALCRAGHDVVLVVTQPPKRRGRRQAPTPSPVAAAAADLGLDITWNLEDAVGVEADLGVVVAYGEHIPDAVLESRRTVNLHFSRLPRWRGAAPVERAILAGDTETGVCLMDVASPIDAGAVYSWASTEISPHETAEELRARLCGLGVGLLLDALADRFSEPVPQQGAVTWADKISPAELRIDWSAPAEHVMRLVRVGGAWTHFRGRRLKVLRGRPSDGTGHSGAASALAAPGPSVAPEALAAPGTIRLASGSGGHPGLVEAATGRGTVELLTVQSEGRAALSAWDWANGARLAGGERFDENA